MVFIMISLIFITIPLLSDESSHIISSFKVALEESRIKEIVFISKWVDYSNKYGLGYQLTDGCVGVLFNDGTKMVLDADQMFESCWGSYLHWR